MAAMTAMPAMMNTIFPALGLGIIKGILIRSSNHNWQSTKLLYHDYATKQLPKCHKHQLLTLFAQSTVEAAEEGEEKVLCSSSPLLWLWLPGESCHLLETSSCTKY